MYVDRRVRVGGRGDEEGRERDGGEDVNPDPFERLDSVLPGLFHGAISMNPPIDYFPCI
jgi:hypothetical protein